MENTPPRKQLQCLGIWRNAKNRKHIFNNQKVDNIWLAQEWKTNY